MWDAWAAIIDHAADGCFPVERPVSPTSKRRVPSRSCTRHTACSDTAGGVPECRDDLAAATDVHPARLRPEQHVDGRQTPAAPGQRIFQTIRDTRMTDGSNEVANYARTTAACPSTNRSSPCSPARRWRTRIAGGPWRSTSSSSRTASRSARRSVVRLPALGQCQSFALTRDNPNDVYIDPGPPPDARHGDRPAVQERGAQVALYSGTLDPNDGVTVDISPRRTTTTRWEPTTARGIRSTPSPGCRTPTTL